MNYRMKLQYDGTRYKGWQRQGTTDTDTIQGRIEMILSKYFDTPVEIYGAGRTDAGVHARGQVANFLLEENLEPQQLMQRLNEYLPEDIRIIEMSYASPRFHSRLHATGKTYEYHIQKSGCYDVFARKYAWNVETPLDVEQMRHVAKCLMGTHDFAGFCTRASKKKSTVRTIYDIAITETEKEIVLRFEGNGFLYHMVRILTGILVEAGRNGCSEKEVCDMLEQKKRSKRIGMAPAKGLILMEVKYD